MSPPANVSNAVWQPPLKAIKHSTQTKKPAARTSTFATSHPPPVVIYIHSPEVIHVEACNFKDVIQKLTGLPGPTGDDRSKEHSTPSLPAGNNLTPSFNKKRKRTSAEKNYEVLAESLEGTLQSLPSVPCLPRPAGNDVSSERSVLPLPDENNVTPSVSEKTKLSASPSLAESSVVPFPFLSSSPPSFMPEAENNWAEFDQLRPESPFFLQEFEPLLYDSTDLFSTYNGTQSSSSSSKPCVEASTSTLWDSSSSTFWDLDPFPRDDMGEVGTDDCARQPLTGFHITAENNGERRR